MNHEILYKDLFLAKRDRQVLNLFWFGFLLYTASYTISTTETVNYNVCQALQIIGILIFIPTGTYLVSLNISNRYLQAIYVIYISWLFIVVFRGIDFNYNSMKFILFDAWFGVFFIFSTTFYFISEKTG